MLAVEVSGAPFPYFERLVGHQRGGTLGSGWVLEIGSHEEGLEGRSGLAVAQPGPIEGTQTYIASSNQCPNRARPRVDRDESCLGSFRFRTHPGCS